MEVRKQLIESLPLLTVLLIGIAFINMQGYYDVINVNIYNYVNTSELILSFIPFLFRICISFHSHVMTFIVVFQIITFINNRKRSKEVLEESYANLGLFSWSKSWITPVLYLVICIIGLVCVNLNMFYYKETPQLITQYKSCYYIEQVTIFAIMYNVVLSQLPIEFSRKNKYFLIAAAFIYLAISVNKYSYLTGKEKILKKQLPYISFWSNDTFIESNNNNLFYGETNDYIFMYVPETDLVNIYTKENLQKISRRRYTYKNKNKEKSQADNKDSLNV